MWTIRDANESDVPGILEIYNDAVLHTTATADERPLTLDHRLRWFEEHRRQGLPVIVAEADGQVVAWGALNSYNPRSGYRFSVENSVYVHPEFRGKGLGRNLLKTLLERAKDLGCHSIIASIDGENAASLALHRSFGFEEAGRCKELIFKFDRWLDVIHLQLVLQ
jgi:phosphinothricin acetyltransferase